MTKKFSIIDLFRYKSLRVMTIMLILLDISIDVSYFLPNFMLNSFNLNIYINGVVVQSSQILACIFSTFTISRLSRKVYSFVCFVIVFLCAFALVFIWDQNNKEIADLESNIIILIVIFVLQFTITT